MTKVVEQEESLVLRLWSLNTKLHLKEPELFDKMADARSGAENVQEKSGTSCHSWRQGKYQWLVESCQKDWEAILNQLPLAKDRTI